MRNSKLFCNFAAAIEKRTKMRRMKHTIMACLLFGGCMALLSSCAAYEKKAQSGAAVELNGHYLYHSTLDSMTLGLSSEDSLRVTQQYIRQWAQDILLYDKAMSHTNAQIEAMVADYRRTLYAQAYEEHLADRNMPKAIMDSSVVAIYAQMPNRFKLDESIMQGMLVVVPVDAPNIAKLRQQMTNQSLDKIEKYVYQNASGYELFEDKWLTTTEVIRQIPVERADFEAKLKAGNHIEIADSTKLYLLQITKKCIRGEAMPLDYARPEIEKIILNARQVEFLRKERERLYNEAIQKQKIHFYEN